MKYTDLFDNGLTDLIPIRKGDKRPTGRWTEVRATRDLVESWQDGNIGLRTAYFPAVDIDVRDAALSALLLNLTREHFGPAPVRVGLAPKCAALYRTETPFQKRWIQFERGTESYRVEVLAGGQYLVVGGTHPSGSEYRWDVLPVADELSVITEGHVDAFMSMVAIVVHTEGWTVVTSRTQSSAAQAPAQDALTGDPQRVAVAVRSTPNRGDIFATREDYLTYGFALKAALPEHPGEAFALWSEWCRRWDGGENTADVIQRDWDSLQPPYRLGADYLYQLAQRYGNVLTAADELPALEGARPETVPEDEQLTPYSHGWMADIFQRRHGRDVRYSPDLGGWMYWTGTHWRLDSLGYVQSLMADIGRGASKIAERTSATPREGIATAKWCLSYDTVTKSTRLAALNRDVAADAVAFDQHPWLLNTPNGMIDLRSGLRMDNNPRLMITRITGVTPSAIPTPRWAAFLQEVTGGDIELEAYLQRLIGYALTGSTQEHVLAFFWGNGGNGKGVFLNTIVRALGTYAAVAGMDTFTASTNDRHPADVAALAGARLVTAQETQEGRSWDEAKVKSITGGDPISARFMRQNYFTFLPQFKLLFAGNHRPRISNLDNAMRRRFHLVPFTRTPVKIDPLLTDVLQGELPGVLQWAVEGCRAWLEMGLQPPLAVRDATAQYFADEDPLGRWMAESVAPSDEVTGTKELYDNWCRWCTEVGESPGSLRQFSMNLRGRGLEATRTSSARGYRLSVIGDKKRTVPLVADTALTDFDLIPLRH